MKMLVLLLPLLMASCTYNEILNPAPNIEWLDREESETQSIMQTLAISISRMEDASVRDLTASERRQEVGDQLQIIEELGELLATDSNSAIAGDHSTRSHQIVNDNIDSFLTKVRQARQEIAKDPPNYFVAGAVVGHCRVCHQVRDTRSE